MTEYEITEAMIQFGGGFVSRLGMLYRAGDAVNQAKLREAFSGYWEEYRELAQLRAKQGAPQWDAK